MSFRKEYPIIVERPVAWGDMDAFGHVNNVRYFSFFEDARIAYFESMGITADANPTSVGPILSHTECRFRAPLTYPDTVLVGARVVAVQNDRFTMEYAVYSKTLDRVAATGSGVVVSYDYGQNEKTEVPEAWRDVIDALESGEEDERRHSD